MSSSISRREALAILTAIAGTGFAIHAGHALGMLPKSTSASILELPSVEAVRPRVVILGAGLSGLIAAFELAKRGCECTVLEASHRSGGRIFTVRGGDFIDELGNPQHCDFDREPHMYINAGAARIPGEHRTLLNYCRLFDIQLELFSNENKQCYVQDDAIAGGRPIRNGVFTSTARGFLADMLSKTVQSGHVSDKYTESEAEALLKLIDSLGGLEANHTYQAVTHHVHKPTIDSSAKTELDKRLILFRQMLKSGWGSHLLNANEGETGPNLLQPVNGMDMIIKALSRVIGDRIHHHSRVTSIHVSEQSVDVRFDQAGKEKTLSADYCLNCIPTHLLSGIHNNFSNDYNDALAHVMRGVVYKSAFQAKSRFWEAEGIYGGITWMNNPGNQIWYPSHGIGKEKGIVLAAYESYGDNTYHTLMSQEERIEAHLHDAEKVHPGFRGLVEKPITIAWHRMNHMLGCYARWSEDYFNWTDQAKRYFQILSQPLRNRHYLIGDQMSEHPGWQESAILSTHRALRSIENQLRNSA